MKPTADIGRLKSLSREDLELFVRNELPSNAWELVRALREEAVPHYSSDAAEARRIADRSVELAELLDEPHALGWGYRALAESLLYSGRMKEAEDAYARAAHAWQSAGLDSSLGQLLVGRIHVLSHLGRHEQVRETTEIARQLLEASDDEVYLAKLAVSLGNAHFQRDEYAAALEEYDRALALFRKMDVRDALVFSLETNRAVALTQLDRDEEGLALYRELEQEAGDHGFELLQAQIRMNAAHVHSQRAEFDQALAKIPQATTYFRQTDHPAFLANCLLNRAEIYHQLNLHHDALELSEESSRLFESEGMRYAQAIAQSQAGISSMALGDFDGARARFEKGRDLFETEKNAARVALMTFLNAEVLFQKRELEEAESQISKALIGFQHLGLLRWEAAAAVLQTHIRHRLGDTVRALTVLEDLADRLPKAIYPLQSYRIFETMGIVHEAEHRTRDAELAYQSAVNCLEDLRVQVPTEDSKIAFLQDKTHLFDRLLHLEIRAPKPSPQKMFDWMERSRAQSLWDRLRSPTMYLEETDEGASSDDATSLGRTRRHLSWLHTRLSKLELGSEEERRQADQLRARVVETEELWTRLVRERRERGRNTRSATDTTRGPVRSPNSPASRVSADSIRETLPDGWGFLSYHLGPDFSTVVIITQDGITWKELDPELGPRVGQLCDRLDFQWNAAAATSAVPARNSGSTARRTVPAGPGGAGIRGVGVSSSLEDTTAEETAATAKKALPNQSSADSGPMRMLRATTDSILSELYDLLWRPLESLLPPDLSWIVSPHGPIHRVPLHALRGDDGYLVEKSDFVVTPSARVWHGLPRPTSKLESAWVAGVPSTQLPAVEMEVDRVARHLRSARASRVLGPTSDLFRRDATRAELIHLAAHGSLRRDNPAFSFVQLADGPLFVHDLVELRFPASTVVLTACSSARGSAPAGDEWIGLARGFLQSGASTVVASLWPIQDQPTLELMDLFYRSFANGNSAPCALGLAMREHMKTRPHPWHWASFATLGGVPTRDATSGNSGRRSQVGRLSDPSATSAIIEGETR